LQNLLNGRSAATLLARGKLSLEICSGIAERDSVRTICCDAAMPSSSTIFRWLLDEDKKEFWEQYAKARAIQAELLFEKLLEIADTPQEGVETFLKVGGV
jgi:hypothetical protein